MPDLPADLAEAFADGGHPTAGQVRQLMELEATAMGLSLAEALDAARDGSLPHSAVGIDFRYLAESLAAA
jgi:hypothetical protein